jgi:hypothetical protein
MDKQKLVKKGNEYGILDVTSNTVLPISANMKLVQKQGKYGILDGDSVIPIDEFSETINDNDLNFLKKKASTVSPSPTKVQNTPSDLPSKSEEVGYLEDLWNRFKGAGTKALSSLVAIPSLAQNAAMDMVLTASGKDEEFNKLPVSVKKDIRNVIKKTAIDPTSIAAVKSQEASDYLNKKADKIYERTIKQEGDIFTDMNNFRKNPSLEGAGQVISRAIRSGVESIPYMGMMALPGSLVTMGLASTAQKRNEDLAENQNAGLGNLLTAGAHGAAEAYFEKYTQGILGRAGKMLAGKPKAATEFAIGIIREIGKDFHIEGMSEAMTTAVQEVADKLNKGEDIEFIPLMRKIADSYLLGGATGAGITGGAYTIKKAADNSVAAKNYVIGKIMPTEQKKKLEVLANQRQNLEFEKGSDSNPIVKKAVDDKIAEIEKQYNSIIDETNTLYDAMSDDDIKSIVSIDNELEDNYNKAKTILDDQTLDQDARDLLLKDLLKKQNELKQQRDAIQKQATSEISVQSEAPTRLQVAEGEPQAEPQITTEEGQAEKVTPEAGGMVQMAEAPKSDNMIEVFHGGNLPSLDQGKPLYVSEDASQANEYAKMSDGEVYKFFLDKDKIASEEDAFKVMEDLGINADGNFFELIDPRFNEALPEEEIKMIFDALKEKGFEAVRYTDIDQKTLKPSIENILVLDASKSLKESPSPGTEQATEEITPSEQIVSEQPTTEAPTVEEEVKNPFDQVKQGQQARQKAVDQIEKAMKRGRSLPQAVQGGISALRKTIAYEEANDVVREAMERQIRKEYGLKEKAAPSVKKILGVPKSAKELVDTMKGLKEQIKLEAKAAKGGAIAVQNAAKELIGKIASLGKAGKITASQASRLTRLFGRNLLNSKTFDSAVSTATKIIEDTQYAKRLDDLSKIRKKLKSFVKNDKKYQADVIEALKKFIKVDPSDVDNLDEYESIAMDLLRATKPITITREGEVSGREATLLSAVNNFSEKEIEKQQERLKNALLDQYDYLVEAGLISSDMSYKDILDYIKSVEENEANEDSTKSDLIKEYNKQAFDDAVQFYNDYAKDEVSDEDKKLLDEFTSMDIEKLPLPKQIMAVDAMQNYLVNGITTNMQAILNPYIGDMKANKDLEDGLVAQDFVAGLIGRIPAVGDIYSETWGEQIAKVDSLIANIFRSNAKALKFLKNSGFRDIVRAFVKAKKIVNDFIESYTEKFKDTNPNGQKFNTAYNTFERGVFADFYRTVIKDKKATKESEFRRKMDLLKETIDELKTGKKSAQKKAQIYEQIYDKIKDAKNIDDIKKQIDPINQQAVQTFVDFWKKFYPELRKIVAEVFNIKLNEDENYTPEFFEKIFSKVEDDLITKTGFKQQFDFVNTEKAGNFLENNRIEKLTRKNKRATHVKDYDFDMNNIRALQSALTDIYTTPYVQQYLGYVNSDAFEKIIPDQDTRDLVRSRLNFNIDALRSKENTASSENIKKFAKAVGSASKYGTRIGLGSMSSAFKQSIPMAANTVINLGLDGPQLLSEGITDYYDNDALNFLKNSGYGISLRGSESQTSIDYGEKLIEKEDLNQLGKIGDLMAKAGDWQIEKFLKNPDVAIANISWFAYYRKKLKDLGENVDNINWSNHKLNEEAADYAEFMVQDQQNMNIAELGGKFLTSKKPGVKIARQLLAPFSSYLFNLKDKNNRAITILTSKNSNTNDKIEAIKSLSAGLIESLIFDGIALVAASFIRGLAYGFAGGDDEKEKLLEKINNDLSKKWAFRLSMSKLLTDYALPTLPQFDYLTIDLINWLIDYFSSDEIPNKKRKRKTKSAIGKVIKSKQKNLEEPFSFYRSKDKSFADYIGGVPAIGWNAFKNVYNTLDDIYSGSYIDKYDNKYDYTKNQRQLIGIGTIFEILNIFNGLPRESAVFSKETKKIIDEQAKINSLKKKKKKKKSEGF